jgi:hypothetical protein
MTSTLPDELSWDPFDTEIDSAPYDHERAVRLHTSTVRGYSSVPIRL